VRHEGGAKPRSKHTSRCEPRQCGHPRNSLTTTERLNGAPRAVVGSGRYVGPLGATRIEAVFIAPVKRSFMPNFSQAGVRCLGASLPRRLLCGTARAICFGLTFELVGREPKAFDQRLALGVATEFQPHPTVAIVRERRDRDVRGRQVLEFHKSTPAVPGIAAARAACFYRNAKDVRAGRFVPCSHVRHISFMRHSPAEGPLPERAVCRSSACREGACSRRGKATVPTPQLRGRRP